jgi:lactoylglutathione lyase
MATKKTSKAKAPAKASTKHPAAKKAKADDKFRLTSASPSFTVNDIEKSMAWYRDVLGFTVTERWEDGGKLLGAEMAAGDVSFMIGQDDWKKGRDRVKGVGVRLYCMTDQDIDTLAARIKANGGTLEGPRDTQWNTRELAVDDPDGYKITIAKETSKR